MSERCMVVCPRDSDDPVNWHGFVCAVPFENKAERATWLSVHSGHCGFDILIDGAWPSPDHLREVPARDRLRTQTAGRVRAAEAELGTHRAVLVTLAPHPSGGFYDPDEPTQCRSGHPFVPHSHVRGWDCLRPYWFCLHDAHGDDDRSRWTFTCGPHERARQESRSFTAGRKSSTKNARHHLRRGDDGRGW